MTDTAEPPASPGPSISALTAPPAPAPEETHVEIHKVKPIHTWRDFLKEVGTIVLGICIALTGEQILEWNHWRNQVKEARAVIASEMTYNLVGAIARMRSAGCVDQRLDTLSRVLDDAARTGGLPPVGAIGGPPRHQWQSGAWDSVVASQAASHFPPEQLAALSSLYKSIQRAEVYGTREMEAWGDLNIMVGPGRRLDPIAEGDLRKTLSRARDLGGTMSTVSSFVVMQAARIDLPFSPAERQELVRIKNRPLTDARSHSDDANTSTICGPIGAVPAGYGTRTGGGSVARSPEAAHALTVIGDAAP